MKTMSETYSTPDDLYVPPSPPPAPKVVELCEHCGREPQSRKSRPVCSKCNRYRRDTGRLPSPELLDQRERIAWARLDPDCPTWENRLLHHNVRHVLIAPVDLAERY